MQPAFMLSGGAIEGKLRNGSRIRCPLDAFLLFAPSLSRLPREQVRVAYLRRGGGVIATETVAEGSAAAASLPIAAILKGAILRRASGLVVAHNHPSGDAMPSRADIDATRRLAAGAAALDLALVDHVVIGHGDARSFRLMGLL